MKYDDNYEVDFMATWLTHLRVADKVSDCIDIKDKTLFFAGSIAPDSGISPDITHWCRNGDKTTCDAVEFFRKHLLKSKDVCFDFYLGYYVHLLTDILWHEHKINPLRHCTKEDIKRVKDGWRCVDYYFLLCNNKFRPFIYLRDTSGLEREWFDYYPVGKVKDLIEAIVNSSCSMNPILCNCDASVVKEINSFISNSSNYICRKLGILYGYYNTL